MGGQNVDIFTGLAHHDLAVAVHRNTRCQIHGNQHARALHLGKQDGGGREIAGESTDGHDARADQVQAPEQSQAEGGSANEGGLHTDPPHGSASGNL